MFGFGGYKVLDYSYDVIKFINYKSLHVKLLDICSIVCIYIGIHIGFTYLIYICIFCPPQRFVHWAAAKFQAPQAQEGRRWNQRSAEYGHVIQRQGEVGPITTGGNDPI